MKIPLVDLRAQHQSIRREIQAAIERVVDESAFVGGRHVEAFERHFAAHCGTRHAVGTSNGTDALMLALRACGIGAGDEVITVPNTFIATTEAIAMVGADVRFVDVEPRSANLDPERLEAAIGPRTKAVIAVHLYGRPADLDRIGDVARVAGLRLIGDAAQAHGARLRGRPIAALADISTYSFYPGKNLGAFGDAGAVATDEADLAAVVARLGNHGRGAPDTHDVEGFNCRLDGLQAAILDVKLRHLDDWTARRRAIAARYTERLADLPDVVTPASDTDFESAWHLYVVRVPQRDRVVSALRDDGVQVGVHYAIPLHRQPAYAHLGLGPGTFPIAEELAREVVSLPIHPQLDDDAVDYVVDRLRAALAP